VTETGATGRLRVSVATLNRLLFPHPENGTPLLAFERTAGVMPGPNGATRVRSKPFGGAVRILNTAPLQALVGEVVFDSERSKIEQDFRIVIDPSQWEAVKQFALQELGTPGGADLEPGPQRELAEEFGYVLGRSLEPDQYTYRPTGFVIENAPIATHNYHARGQLTVRLYQIFEVRIVDESLGAAMWSASERYSDEGLAKRMLADKASGGTGRTANLLALPLNRVAEAYLRLPPDQRYAVVTVQGHQLHESVPAVLEGVEVPEYLRL